MNTLFRISTLAVLIIVSFAQGGVVYDKAQCSAYGHMLRSQGSSNTDYLVNSRFAINLQYDEQKDMAKASYLGFIEIETSVEKGQTRIEEADYYSLFRKSGHLSSKSKRARAYPDSHYFRFRNFNAASTSSGDGGGMWGYFVISKKVLQKGAAFDAHYVFQAGDHMGGTVDFQCRSSRY